MEHPTRRNLLVTGMAAAGSLGLIAPARSQAPLAATPECSDKVTLKQTEGPFYKPRTPERADLVETGMRGRVIELAGFVLTRDCRPVARALVDLWQADEAGAYDNKGFRLRGHQYTDAQGRYRFRTIAPAAYVGRTRHFHVKVAAQPYRSVLTTQLYFPDEPGNARDGLFRKDLLMRVAGAGEGLAGRFDFVLEAG